MFINLVCVAMSPYGGVRVGDADVDRPGSGLRDPGTLGGDRDVWVFTS
ncbi:hypothetical protein [Mycobacterium leprae]|nr:hypothetical protein [Mycobacterium leprae]